MFYGTVIYVMATTVGILFGILTIFRSPFTLKETVRDEETDAKYVISAKVERLEHILRNRGDTISSLLSRVQELQLRKKKRRSGDPVVIEY